MHLIIFSSACIIVFFFNLLEISLILRSFAYWFFFLSLIFEQIHDDVLVFILFNVIRLICLQWVSKKRWFNKIHPPTSASGDMWFISDPSRSRICLLTDWAEMKNYFRNASRFVSFHFAPFTGFAGCYEKNHQFNYKFKMKLTDLQSNGFPLTWIAG